MYFKGNCNFKRTLTLYFMCYIDLLLCSLSCRMCSALIGVSKFFGFLVYNLNYFINYYLKYYPYLIQW